MIELAPGCVIRKYFQVSDSFGLSFKLMPPDSAKRQPDGIWIIDAGGKTVYANESMADILGTTPVAILGEDSFFYVFPEDMAAAQHLFSSKQGGSPAPFRFRLRRKDGSSVWVDVQGTPMHNAAGLFTGIVGTFRVSDQQNS